MARMENQNEPLDICPGRCWALVPNHATGGSADFPFLNCSQLSEVTGFEELERSLAEISCHPFLFASGLFLLTSSSCCQHPGMLLLLSGKSSLFQQQCVMG